MSTPPDIATKLAELEREIADLNRMRSVDARRIAILEDFIREVTDHFHPASTYGKRKKAMFKYLEELK
jgi:hypothetical protein